MTISAKPVMMSTDSVAILDWPINRWNCLRGQRFFNDLVGSFLIRRTYWLLDKAPPCGAVELVTRKHALYYPS